MGSSHVSRQPSTAIEIYPHGDRKVLFSEQVYTIMVKCTGHAIVASQLRTLLLLHCHAILARLNKSTPRTQTVGNKTFLFYLLEIGLNGGGEYGVFMMWTGVNCAWWDNKATPVLIGDGMWMGRNKKLSYLVANQWRPNFGMNFWFCQFALKPFSDDVINVIYVCY